MEKHCLRKKEMKDERLVDESENLQRRASRISMWTLMKIASMRDCGTSLASSTSMKATVVHTQDTDHFLLGMRLSLLVRLRVSVLYSPISRSAICSLRWSVLAPRSLRSRYQPTFPATCFLLASSWSMIPAEVVKMI